MSSSDLAKCKCSNTSNLDVIATQQAQELMHGCFVVGIGLRQHWQNFKYSLMFLKSVEELGCLNITIAHHSCHRPRRYPKAIGTFNGEGTKGVLGPFTRGLAPQLWKQTMNHGIHWWFVARWIMGVSQHLFRHTVYCDGCGIDLLSFASVLFNLALILQFVILRIVTLYWQIQITMQIFCCVSDIVLVASLCLHVLVVSLICFHPLWLFALVWFV